MRYSSTTRRKRILIPLFVGLLLGGCGEGELYREYAEPILCHENMYITNVIIHHKDELPARVPNDHMAEDDALEFGYRSWEFDMPHAITIIELVYRNETRFPEFLFIYPPWHGKAYRLYTDDFSRTFQLLYARDIPFYDRRGVKKGKYLSPGEHHQFVLIFEGIKDLNFFHMVEGDVENVSDTQDRSCYNVVLPDY